MAVLECKDLSKHYGNAPALNQGKRYLCIP